MKLLKKKKKIVIIAIIVLVILFLFLIYNILFGTTGSSEYGNRLKGIDDVKISSSVQDKIKDEISEEDEVEKVSYKLKGRIVNVIITLKDDTPLDRGKEIANKVLEYFDDDQKAYYDFQVFLNSDNDESETYPKIGYMHNSDSLVWKQE